jgi:hypothetical protein
MKKFFLVYVVFFLSLQAVLWNGTKGYIFYNHLHSRRLKSNSIDSSDWKVFVELTTDAVKTCEGKLNGILVYYNNVSERWRGDLKNCCRILKEALADFSGNLASLDIFQGREELKEWLNQQLQDIKTKAGQRMDEIIRQVDDKEPKSHTLSQVKEIKREVLTAIGDLFRTITSLLEEL